MNAPGKALTSDRPRSDLPVAAETGASPAQILLAWLRAQGDGIAPIPGTKRVARVEENTADDGIVLTPDQLARLNALPAASG